MLISPSFVLVKEITSNIPRSNFLEDDLNLAAELILQAEGIIQPLVLRPIGLDVYEVVDGHFEYYAAVRAKEIDSRRGERIGAFIIEGKNKDVLQQQVGVFRKREDPAIIAQNETEEAIIHEPKNDFTEVFKNLETAFKDKIESINQKLEQLNARNVVVSPSHSEELNHENLLNQIEKLVENKFQVYFQEIQNSLHQQLDNIRVEIREMTSLPAQQSSVTRPDKNQLKKYDKMNKTQLKKIATERDIKGRSTMSKEQLVAAILESEIK